MRNLIIRTNPTVDFGPVVTDDGGMRRAPVLRLALVAGLALALAGCGSSTEPPADSDVPTSATTPTTPTTSSTTTGTPTAPMLTTPADGKAIRVTMTGTIEDGVENGCLVFTDEATGETYSITTDDLPGSSTGPRVTITGTVDPEMVSFCQQGPVLLVDEVTDPTD